MVQMRPSISQRAFENSNLVAQGQVLKSKVTLRVQEGSRPLALERSEGLHQPTGAVQ
jgi:hypothetical protein